MAPVEIYHPREYGSKVSELKNLVREVLVSRGIYSEIALKNFELGWEITIFDVGSSPQDSYPVCLFDKRFKSSELHSPNQDIIDEVNTELNAIRHEEDTVLSPFSSLADPD